MKFDLKFGLTAVAEGVLVLALAACGGGGEAGTDTTATASADTAGPQKSVADVVAPGADTGAIADQTIAEEDIAEQSDETVAAASVGDKTAPALTLTGTAWSTVGKSRSFAGTSTDNVAVSAIYWYNARNNVKGMASLSKKNSKSITWTIPTIPVVAGENTIVIAAYDAAGNKARAARIVTINGNSVTTRVEGAAAPAPTPAPAPAPAPTPAPAPAPTPAPAPAPALPAGGGSASGSVSPACATYYNGGFAASVTQLVDSILTLGKPAKGRALAEPNYKTCLTRTTDHTADGTASFARNDYSRRQAFNSNSTRQLVYANDGFWHLYDANSHARLKKLVGMAGDAEPQWDATNPDVLYFVPTTGIGMKLSEMNVSTGAIRVVGDFAARLKAKWPGAAAAWTKSEGSPSADGRYWCFMVDNASWGSVGIFTWDRLSDTITGTYSTNGDRPDHVSMSPSGNYCVVSGDGAIGTTSFSRDFSKSTKLLKNSEHSDLALDKNGDDQYVAIDYASNDGDVFMHNLRTNVRTKLFSTYVNGTATALHVSGKAFNKRGWVVISTYGESGGAQKWLHKKIMAVQLAANPKIVNLAFHRSGANGYWTTPVASVNRDFTRVVYNSNWGNGSTTDVDAYSIEIPASTLN